MNAIEAYRNELISRYPVLENKLEQLTKAASLVIEAYTNKKKLLVCGNGGSAADSEHIVGELMKGFVLRRPLSPELKKKLLETDGALGPHIAETLQQGLPAIALTQHTALSSAFANDADPLLVYAQQLLAYACEGDVFLGISTSGGAKNVLAAAITARALGIAVIGLTGEGGGQLSKYCDVCIDVPEKITYKVQELHLPVYHYLCLAVEHSLFQN